MNSLVLELQQDAYNPSVSVINLLRKALIVASKLNLDEFEQWIELELHGYNGQPIPEYRLVQGQIRAWNPYHGWQPIMVQDQSFLEIFENLCNPQIPQSVSELVALIDSGENDLRMQMIPKIEQLLIAITHAEVKVTISSASVKRIVESVRDIILRWALKLEKDGITGQGMTFSTEEKQIAAKSDYSSFIQINIGQSQMQNQSASSQSNSESFSNDLRGSGIANFANKVQDNASQVASNFSQNIGKNITEINALMASLRQMAQEFPQPQREEAMVHLDDLQEDITKPEKQKPQRIKTRIIALLTIAGTIFSSVAGAADFSNNVLELSEKIGIPIDEINLPQIMPKSPD